MDDKQLQLALEFAREFKKLEERTGFSIGSCGCCGPSLRKVTDADGYDHNEAAADIMYALDLEKPYDSSQTPEQRCTERQELIRSIKAMLS